ncbi:PorH family porin [Corynebacterium sp. CCM 9204]|uniref:PorH family porin n=1 Tax=Corynebacterium sp. CCM 9204 TaxID=3057616 RepID=UPI003523353B
MDFTVIKDQLGDFSTFVEAVNKLIENFPKVVAHLGQVADGSFSSALGSSK